MDKYSFVLERLFSCQATGKASLHQVGILAQALGNPQLAIPVVHVAGSNGKGSVCYKIAKALEKANLKVGLYTSPHLHCYTERIQINGSRISKEEVVEGLETLFYLCYNMQIRATFFELTTILALLHFKKNKVDVAIVETGLGGRLDATRIFEPILSIITSISLEHTHLLGNTLEEIGKEKAGICKMGVPLVLGPSAQLSVVNDIALRLKCPIYNAAITKGFYDLENQEIARSALILLQNHFQALRSLNIEDSLSQRPPCRLEHIGSIYFDVGHNPEAFRQLFDEIKRRHPDKKIHAVIGLSSDKDVNQCLKIAASSVHHITLVQALGLRPACKENMASILLEEGYSSFSIEESIQIAVRNLEEADCVGVVCGSFYIMDEAKAALSISL